MFMGFARKQLKPMFTNYVLHSVRPGFDDPVKCNTLNMYTGDKKKKARTRRKITLVGCISFFFIHNTFTVA